jgi:DNA-binding beta-propeller fold protein YncE
MVREVSGWDCCCFSRSVEDFQELQEDQVLLLLKYNQTSIETLYSIQCLAFILWLAATMIPGFSLFDGLAGSTSAYTHAGFWAIIEFVTIWIGGRSTTFILGYSTTTGKIEKGVGSAIQWCTFYMIVLGLGFAGNIVHSAFVFAEISGCGGVSASTLCTSYYWVLVFLSVFLLVLAVLKFWTGIRVRTYQNNLYYALGSGKLDTATSLSDENDVETAAPSTPSGGEGTGSAVVAVNRRIRNTAAIQSAAHTPLLAQLDRHGSKFK